MRSETLVRPDRTIGGAHVHEVWRENPSAGPLSPFGGNAADAANERAADRSAMQGRLGTLGLTTRPDVPSMFSWRSRP